MLRSIGRALVEAGHEVTIWTEDPCYKLSDRAQTVSRREILDGMIVERLAKLPDSVATDIMRLADKLLFVPRLMLKAIIQRTRGVNYDLVWTATIPPVLQGWAGRKIAKIFGARFLYHCQDLYPELAAHMGFWRKGALFYRIMASIEGRTRRCADLLVTLSDDMAATVCALGAPRRLAVINNFPLEDFLDCRPVANPSSAPALRGDDKVQLIFAGNLGLFQGLEAVVDAMRLVETECPELELVLLGEGKALPSLEKRASGLSNVRFEPHRPYGEARRLIANADVGLVSLEPGIQRYAFPSKTLTYLELGVPVLAIVDPDSELARMITCEELGWVSPGRDSGMLRQALLAVADEVARTRNRGKPVSVPNREEALDRWKQELMIEASAARPSGNFGPLAVRP